MTTRNQHYVWQHYLKGWATDNDQVLCSRDSKIFASNTKNIMVERDFYKLMVPTKQDVLYFGYWVEKCAPALQKMHRDFFDAYYRIAKSNQYIQNSDSASDEDKYQVHRLSVELEEKCIKKLKG